MPQNRGAIWGHILVRVLALITIPLHSDEPDLALKTTAQFGREYGARSRVLFLLQNLWNLSHIFFVPDEQFLSVTMR